MQPLELTKMIIIKSITRIVHEKSTKSRNQELPFFVVVHFGVAGKDQTCHMTASQLASGKNGLIIGDNTHSVREFMFKSADTSALLYYHSNSML